MKKLTFFLNFKGALIKRLAPGLIIVIVLISVFVYYTDNIHKMGVHVSAALPGYMSVALGLLLVFRNSTAYEKWWEARKEVGALVNTCRNITIDLNGLLPPNTPENTRIANLVTGYAYALKEHLRDGVKMEELQHLDPKDLAIVSAAKHKPNIIANQMINRIESLRKQGLLNDMQEFLLIKEVNGLIDILGKCERIKNTPLPGAYTVLLKFFISIYVIVIPISVAEDIGWACLPLGTLIYFILMSIVVTAEEIEEPFGRDLNDLQMETICKNIKSNVEELVILE